MMPTDYSFIFQFHKGTIRTLTTPNFGEYMRDFNSIKVQLELAIPLCHTLPHIFQFHKGTIRTNQQQGRRQDNHISIP